MNQLVPLLTDYIEKAARPHLQTKVTEQFNQSRGELKNGLPSTIMNFLTGQDGNGGNSNPMVSKIIDQLGPNFQNRLTSITNTTIDVASQGMDTLLTDGIMNITKGVLIKQSNDATEGGSRETGGFNFDFFKSGKDGMVKTTMAASTPLIKQISDNMGQKLSSSFPAAIGGAIQQVIDEKGGANGALGMAAGLISKFVGSHAPGDQSVNGGGDTRDIQATGGSTGGIQQLLQNLLAPKILLLIQPYMQKFEAQMNETLESELRNKVFSVDYIKQTVLDMLKSKGDGNGGASAIIGSVMTSLINKGSSKSNDGSQSEGQKSSKHQALDAISGLASSFLKTKEKK
ncbi:hypothetical protein B0O80DRAFT_472150 [Mortierella sp. GBAus27b]|nr:hypothetical protein BGX31_004982 [Mortierella sp. GBA43]KAI8345705.1 hypothetical protein B0O80DRAFT_472150 [Mortierella sp. GBAus27b]